MNKSREKSSFFNLAHYTLTLLGVWTLIVIGLIWKEYADIQDHTLTIATATAQAHLDKDKSFRFWGTSHGGVYVPVRANTPPNPYLIRLEDRDIITPSGQNLTLMNPEYMVRHMNESFSELYGVSGHITSLKPLRPENGADEWETKALLNFEKGLKQSIEIIENIGREPVLRLMEPLFVKEGCLKCHGHQGYKVGDIRGGVGVKLPMADFIRYSNNQLLLHSVSLAFLWIFGCVVIYVGSGNLKKRTAELAVLNVDLQQQVKERIKTQRLLKKESTFTAAIQDTAGALILVLDIEGKIIRFNQTCEQLSGYTFAEAQNKYFWDMLLPKAERLMVREHFIKSMQTVSPDHYEAPLLTKDGHLHIIKWANTTFWDEAGELEYMISTGIDITEAKQLQEQLLHAEKLTAVGKLSASIAHEINNPLFGIKNVLERLQEKGNLDSGNSEFADLAIQECDRIKNLIIDLQSFNRPSSGVMAPINIHKVIENMLLLSRKEMENKKIKVVRNFSSQVGDIQAIDDQIKQVLLNLINNGIESMPSGGIITVSTGLDTNRRNIKITITDSGTGIKQKDLKHIFEPFFTTKSAVKGTGLGLSVSYGIIKKHGGNITVESLPGKGTIFTIHLPIEGQLA